MMKIFIWIVFVFSFFSGNGQLNLSKIFSDNMVLQRDEPIVIWGKGNPQDLIQVNLDGKIQRTKTLVDSTWKVKFKAMPASTSAHTLTIQSPDSTIQLQNILLGDVWLCLGQSNMEWPMSKEEHYLEAIQNHKNIPLRFYNPTYAGKNIFGTTFSDSVIQKLHHQSFYEGQWQVSDTNSFASMSAVAYYFGKEIVENTNIPIGLINLSIGGAPIETFIDPEAMKKHPKFKNKMDGNWLENDYLPEWIRVRAKENVGSKENVPQNTNGKNHAFKPGFAFVAGIQSLTDLPIKGILFYQGESNAQEMDRVLEYRELSILMVEGYRGLWKKKRLPFYFAQLSSIDTLKYKGQFWPLFRNEQRKLMRELPYSGMAVTADHGMKNDVHPRNKKIVGERLALWALKNQYNQNKVTFGPQPLKAVYKESAIEIYFDKPLFISGSTQVKGFSFNCLPAPSPMISGRKIKIPSPLKPDYVEYGWTPFTDGNLIGKEKLPTSTFRLKIQ
jgi:sialate O-acetylesterase